MKFKYLRKQISHLSWVFTHSQKKQGWHFSSEYLGIVGWASKKEARHLTICVYKICIYIYYIYTVHMLYLPTIHHIWTTALILQRSGNMARHCSVHSLQPKTHRFRHGRWVPHWRCWDNKEVLDYIMLYHTCTSTGERIESRPICSRTWLTLQ